MISMNLKRFYAESARQNTPKHNFGARHQFTVRGPPEAKRRCDCGELPQSIQSEATMRLRRVELPRQLNYVCLATGDEVSPAGNLG